MALVEQKAEPVLFGTCVAEQDAEPRFTSTTTASAEEELDEFPDMDRQCSELSTVASMFFGSWDYEDSSVKSLLAQCDFCATIAESKGDYPMLAVSDGFELLTGYSRAEIIGKSCRFLREDCWNDPAELIGIRAACATGAPFSVVLTNQRKTGELFRTFLSIRGLRVAENPVTGEGLVFLVGVHADVTHMIDIVDDADALPLLHQFASAIQDRMVFELAHMALAGASAAKDYHVDDGEVRTIGADNEADAVFHLLPTPRWVDTDAHDTVITALLDEQSTRRA